MQETRVWSQVREDPTCFGATKPRTPQLVTCAPEPGSQNHWSPRRRACADGNQPERHRVARACRNWEKPHSDKGPTPPKTTKAIKKKNMASPSPAHNQCWKKKTACVRFYKKIIALQYCAGFCHTAVSIGHRYTDICPFPLEPASHLPRHPTPLGCHRELGEKLPVFKA